MRDTSLRGIAIPGADLLLGAAQAVPLPTPCRERGGPALMLADEEREIKLLICGSPTRLMFRPVWIFRIQEGN